MIKIIFKKLCFIFVILLLLYTLLLGVLYTLQHKIIYHPSLKKPEISQLQKKFKNLKEVSYSLPNGKRVYAWFLKSQKSKKIIVFFHGNTGDLIYNSKNLPFFEKNGFSVLIPEYEGFGGIKGNLRQAELEQDAKTALLWVLSKGYKPQDIIIYGHSLGTYVALFGANFMAKEKESVSAVILEAPFYSLTDMAHHRLGNLIPVSLLLKDNYPSKELIDQIKTPLFLGHGKKDTVIPYIQGLKLFEKAHHPKTFFSSDKADHNSLPQNGFIDAILPLLKK